MGRHPALRTKLRRDIRRTWTLFTALVVMVMLGIALYGAADNSFRNLQGSYDNAFEVQGFPDLFVTGGDVEAYAAAAAQDPSVAATRMRTQADLPMAGHHGRGDRPVRRACRSATRSPGPPRWPA